MTPASTSAPKAEKPAFPRDVIRAAIADGKAIIKDGKTRVEAATAIYAKLKTADRESRELCAKKFAPPYVQPKPFIARPATTA